MPNFFPVRDEREVFDWAIDDFPFPLSITYARLQDELDNQAPIAAAWQMRDAFEVLLKFTTCIAIADFLRANPDPEDAGKIVGLLFKRSGLSLGDWFTLLIGQDDKVDKGAVRQLESFARSASFEKSGRLFPELFNLFFKLKGKEGKQFSELTKRLKGKGDSTNPNKHGFIDWRNRVFGHGAFKSNCQFYAEETQRWLPVLHEFLKALRPLFTGWQLLSISREGEQIAWQGANRLPTAKSHIHEHEGEPTAMLFTHHASSRSLNFGPLLSVQQCIHCKQPTTFFFDSNRYDRTQERHKTYFLEYFGGHEVTYQNWRETQKLATKLPPHFEWQRTSYDSQEVQTNLALIFRNYDKELVRPDYLVNNFWRIVDEQTKGYVWLVGESGMGKTFFVRALEREGKTPVLAYYILSGALSDYRTFVSELSNRARETLNFRTQEAQTKVAAITDLQKQFAEYIAELMRANGLETLILAIDAIDELREPDAGTPIITNLLPSPERLPAGCFVLLTSREELRPGVRRSLEWLEQRDTKIDQPKYITHIRIRPHDAENRTLVQGYLQQHLPEQFRDETSVETVLQRCEGVFLYAFHFCRALESAAFTSVDNLPEGRDFYPTYLAQLREASGKLYDQVYLKALVLLAAARIPVSTNQLIAWGIPKKDLPVELPLALLGIKDFLRLHRSRLWHDNLSEDEVENRYDIAHDAFIRYLREDPLMAEQLREAHTLIARKALSAHTLRWNKLDPEDETQLYDLRFVMTHLKEAGLNEEAAALQLDELYATVCLAVGNWASDGEKNLIAIDLYDHTIEFYRNSVAQGHDRSADLAAVLMNKGYALWKIGQLVEVLPLYDESISINRALIEAGQGEVASVLAAALMNKGNALGTQAKSAEALEFFEEAIEIWRTLIKTGRSEFANNLARALMNNGNALRNLGRLPEAEALFDESIKIRQGLVDGGASNVSKDLARAVANKGAALKLAGKLEEAINHFDYAISIYLSEGNAGSLDDWLHVLLNKGNALSDLGKLEEAMQLYDETIRLYRELVHEGRNELANHLAGVLMNKGNILRDTDESEAAILHYDEAISIYQALIKTGRNDLADDLALVLLNKGNTLLNQDKPGEAIKLYDETINFYQQLVKAGNSEFASELASVLMNKGNALTKQGKLSKALKLYDQAITIRRQLVEAGRNELVRDLAFALMNKGHVLFNHGKNRKALDFYDEAHYRYHQLFMAGRNDLADEFMLILNSKGVALIKAGRMEEAINLYGNAIVIVKQLLDSGRSNKVETLAGMMTNKGFALMNHGRLREAIVVYDESLALHWQLVNSNGGDMESIISVMENRAIALARLKDWDSLIVQFDESINLQLALIDDGMTQWLPGLMQVTGWRLEELLALKRWDAAAQGLSDVLNRIAPHIRVDVLSKQIAETLTWIRKKINTLADDEQEKVYAGLGEQAEVLRSF